MSQPMNFEFVGGKRSLAEAKLDFIERVKDEIEELEAVLAAVEGYKPGWRTVDNGGVGRLVDLAVEKVVINGQDKPKRKYTKRSKRWKRK
jgi:hypothetical protein